MLPISPEELPPHHLTDKHLKEVFCLIYIFSLLRKYQLPRNHTIDFSLTFALAGDLVPEDVDLVHWAKVLEHDLQQDFQTSSWALEDGNPDRPYLQLGLVHRPRHLTDEHLDGVGVRMLRNDRADSGVGRRESRRRFRGSLGRVRWGRGCG